MTKLKSFKLFWDLNRQDADRRLLAFKASDEYKFMREKLQKLYAEAYHQNYGGGLKRYGTNNVVDD